MGIGIALVVGLWIFRAKIVPANLTPAKKDAVIDVSVPTIINGQLVLPKIATESDLTEQSTVNLGKRANLGVISANLVPIVDQQKLTGLRILGEMANIGEQTVIGISPVIRFFDVDGKTLAQKIGRISGTWNFFGLSPQEKTLYDITVDNPPQAEKLEIVLNVSSASDSAIFEELKLASRGAEIKTASDSAGQVVEYYSVSGQVVNTLEDPVSDIAIYAWVRNKEGKVFSFNRQDFKNDLLTPGNKIDFKITLLPFKNNETMDSYEVAAWGKRYRLNL